MQSLKNLGLSKCDACELRRAYHVCKNLDVIVLLAVA